MSTTCSCPRAPRSSWWNGTRATARLLTARPPCGAGPHSPGRPRRPAGQTSRPGEGAPPARLPCRGPRRRGRGRLDRARASSCSSASVRTTTRRSRMRLHAASPSCASSATRKVGRTFDRRGGRERPRREPVHALSRTPGAAGDRGSRARLRPTWPNASTSVSPPTLRTLGLVVATGRFGAEMAVELVNDGPFTIWLDTAEG